MDRNVSIQESIKKNSLPLFKRPKPKVASKARQQVTGLKSDCSLFSQLCIASKYRDGDLDDFFAHENHPWPPALSDNGKLYLPSQKSDLLCLLLTESQPEPPTSFQVKIFDGAAVVHSLQTSSAATFGDYGDNVFLPWTKQQLQDCDRIDIVWDTYKTDSIKEATREKRGKGIRRKVGEKTKMPGNFADFLRDPTNKEELFGLLTMKVTCSNYGPGKDVYITSSRW